VKLRDNSLNLEFKNFKN